MRLRTQKSWRAPCPETDAMDSNFRRACLELLGLTLRILMKDGQAVVETA
jgi:hypothetical protein